MTEQSRCCCSKLQADTGLLVVFFAGLSPPPPHLQQVTEADYSTSSTRALRDLPIAYMHRQGLSCPRG